jgi:multisubunit Na+/H+ antiporter MnhB subunit
MITDPNIASEKTGHPARVYPCWGFLGLLAGFLWSALFHRPPQISFSAMVVGLVTAGFCTAVFGLCPRRPRWAKFLASVPMILSVAMVVFLAAAYYRYGTGTPGDMH